MPEMPTNNTNPSDAKKIADLQSELKSHTEDYKFQLAQAAVDVAGIFDPTPTSDVIGAGMSLASGDVLGAGLSLISIFPYVGDAIGKTAKGARVAKKIAELQNKIKKVTDALVAAEKRAKNKLLNKAAKKAVQEAAPKANKATKKVALQACPKQVARELKIVRRKVRKTLTPAQRKIFDDLLEKMRHLDATPPKDSAIFYAGTKDGIPSWKAVNAIKENSKGAKVDINDTELGKYLTEELKKVGLPDNAVDSLWREASKKLAQSVTGNVEFVGDLKSITPDKVFYRIEIDTVLNNPNVSEASKATFKEIKQQLDAQFNGG